MDLTVIDEECRTLKQTKNLKLVVIDSPQPLMPMDRTTWMHDQAVSQTVHELKLLAGELDIAMVLICQLGPGPERRDGKTPRLSDLQRSGSLAQDTDVVFLVHRAEIYDVWDHPGKADIIMAKNHNGPTMTFHLEFQSVTSKFVDLPKDPDSEECPAI